MRRGRVRGITAVAGGTRNRIDADIVIGADGLHSTIARRVDAARVVEGRHATGVLYSYWEGLPVDGYYWWFRPGASIGAIPTNDGATCLFVSVPSARFRAEIRGDASRPIARLIRRGLAGVDARLARGRRVEPVRGFGGHVGFIKRSTGPGMGAGRRCRVFQGSAHRARHHRRAARCRTAGARRSCRGRPPHLTDYETTRVDLSRRLFDITDEIASFAWTDERSAGAASRVQRRNVARGARTCRVGATHMSIAVGQRASRSLTLTAQHVRTFAEISGDYNPLHFDEAFAARTKFGRLVVQGGLTTGLVHALVAMDMPGPGHACF